MRAGLSQEGGGMGRFWYTEQRGKSLKGSGFWGDFVGGGEEKAVKRKSE